MSKKVTANEDTYRHPPLYVIREIYDSENACEIFEQQLERALAQECEIIVIEPFKLGDETARWIAAGNWLHKTAVLAGFGSLVAAFVWPDKPFINCPLVVLSTLCTGLYSISWQFDPCCKYQVESDPQQLNQLDHQSLNSSSPIVLVRKDDTRRKILHTAVTLACLTQVGLRYNYPSIYRIFSPAYSNSAAVLPSTTSFVPPPGKLVISNYSKRSPLDNMPVTTGFMNVLAEGVGILES